MGVNITGWYEHKQYTYTCTYNIQKYTMQTVRDWMLAHCPNNPQNQLKNDGESCPTPIPPGWVLVRCRCLSVFFGGSLQALY